MLPIYTDVHKDSLGCSWRPQKIKGEQFSCVILKDEAWRRCLNTETLDIKSFKTKQEQKILASFKYKELAKRSDAGCHDCQFTVKSPEMASLLWTMK